MRNGARDNGHRVSVALCTYNGERFLPELLDSLTRQTSLPDELIVCDDRSPDRSVAIVERFAEAAPFPVKLHVGEFQRGVTENFGWAIALCTGDLISLCDQDDVWLPHKLERSVAAFREQPRIGFTFSNAHLVDDELGSLGRTLWDAVGFSDRFQSDGAAGNLLPHLIPFTFVTGATMVFRADLRDVVLPLPREWHHDAWIAVVSCMLRPYAMLDEESMLYRQHGDQAIGVPARAVTNIWKMRWSDAISLGKVDLHRQRRRVEATRLRTLIDRYRSAGAAYKERSGLPQTGATDELLQELEERAQHSAMRGSLPDRRVERLPMILNELRGRGYRRFSAGLLSAVQDVLY